jgi:hypothetical protein
MNLRDISMDENRGTLRRVLCRERRRRQPPKVSGSLAAPNPKAIFEGAPMTLRDISINENFGALRRVLCRERRRRQPPKVSGSLAAPQPNSDFRGSPHDPAGHQHQWKFRRPAAGSEPRTKAASAAESERFPRGPTTQRRFSRGRSADEPAYARGQTPARRCPPRQTAAKADPSTGICARFELILPDPTGQTESARVGQFEKSSGIN